MENELKITSKSGRVVVFDFDGTIADGESMFLSLLNSQASRFGYQPVTVDQIPELKNMGAKEFVSKRLGLPLWDIVRIEKIFRQEYGLRMSEVKLFPGMEEVFQKLKQAGHRIGILSSNSSESINKFLKDHNVNGFDFVYSGSSLLGKARVIKNMIKSERINIGDVIYIGDEVRDVEAAHTAGVPVIAVGWGLNSVTALKNANPDFLAEHPPEILTYMGI